MRRFRTLLVFGTRPEAIKLAPVLHELRRRPDRFEAAVCLTGQHREMLDQALEAFGVVPEADLAVMRPDQKPAGVAADILRGLSPRLSADRPDIVLVQGDTITTFAATLAAFLEKIPVAHVEAGLRSGDPYRPFPEEMSRRLTTTAASLHFAPTAGARDNLLREGIPGDRVEITGNTVVDALQMTLRDGYVFRDAALQSVDFNGPVVLVTMHRRESFGAPLRAAAEAMRDIAESRADVRLVFPVHHNPNVRGPMEEILGSHPRIVLTEPVDYPDFVHLMARSTIALTDSGGIQEEGPSVGLPVLVMRDVTERPEGIAAGTARLVGTHRQRIVTSVLALLDDPEERRRMAEIPNPYGDGRASARIADALERFLSPAG